jgi:signal peptidase
MTPEIPDRKTTLRVLATVVLLAAVVPFVVFAAPSLAGADQSYVVLSSSMEPTFGAGDVILVSETDDVTAGDVITFRSDRRAATAASGSEYVTHRVVEVVERDDGRYFRTRGDANDAADQRLVPADAVVGEVSTHVPLAGHVVLFARSQFGFLALAVVPFGLLAVSEIRSLLRATSDGDSSGGKPP